MFFVVLGSLSEVTSIVTVLRPPNEPPESSVHSLNKHECVDTGDGNYTCNGTMEGMCKGSIKFVNVKTFVTEVE